MILMLGNRGTTCSSSKSGKKSNRKAQHHTILRRRCRLQLQCISVYFAFLLLCLFEFSRLATPPKLQWRRARTISGVPNPALFCPRQAQHVKHLWSSHSLHCLMLFHAFSLPEFYWFIWYIYEWHTSTPRKACFSASIFRSIVNET